MCEHPQPLGRGARLPRVPSSASGGSPVAIACPACPPLPRLSLHPEQSRVRVSAGRRIPPDGPWDLCRVRHRGHGCCHPRFSVTPLLPAGFARGTCAMGWNRVVLGIPGGGSDPASPLSGQILTPGLHPACTVGARLPFKSPSRGDRAQPVLGDRSQPHGATLAPAGRGTRGISAGNGKRRLVFSHLERGP